MLFIKYFRCATLCKAAALPCLLVDDIYLFLCAAVGILNADHDYSAAVFLEGKWLVHRKGKLPAFLR